MSTFQMKDHVYKVFYLKYLLYLLLFFLISFLLTGDIATFCLLVIDKEALWYLMTFSLITLALMNDKLIISTLLKPLKTVTWNFYLYVKFTLKLLQSIHIRKVLGSLLAVIVPEKFWTFSKNTNNFFYTIYRRKTKFKINLSTLFFKWIKAEHVFHQSYRIQKK